MKPLPIAAAQAPTSASRRAIAGWLLFDWACQPFFTLVTTFVFAPYFAAGLAENPVVGQSLWGYATAHLPIAASTSLLYLVPPIAVLIAWLWLGEVPVAAELAGGLVVIAGVLIISQGGKIAARRPVRGRRGTSHAYASSVME